MMNLVLIGYRGTGKTTIGQRLAQKLGLEFAECDSLIEKKAGMPITEIFKRFGEGHFRNLESEVVKEACAKGNSVIATGGGAPMRSENAAAMKRNSIVILLTCPPEVILERIGNDSNRPALTSLGTALEEIKFMLQKRNPTYKALANFISDTGSKKIEETLAEILAFLKKEGVE